MKKRIRKDAFFLEGEDQMKCPNCACSDSKVVDSRPTDEGQSIRRRRECMECGFRFTTYEKIEEVPLMVIKKNGTRESFDRSKVLSGIIKSCEKRPVSYEEMEMVEERIERQLNGMNMKEIPSTLIGELVMNELKTVDEVAYVRFASVYRQFKDVNSFMDELKKILGETEE